MSTEVLTGYAPYDSYKESGIDWLGEVPKNWKVERLGVLLTEVSDKNYPELPLLSITRELGVIERDVDNLDSNHNFIPDDLSGYKKIEKGQFGMNKMKAWQGSYGVSHYTGIVSPAYYVFDIHSELNREFFSLAIRSKLYISYFGSASDGVRIGQWDLNKTRMRQIPFVIPSLDEQDSIVSFINEKITQIDKAINLKQQQIEKINEYKQITIQNAVTKGLNPDVKMKDSGIDWIGDIPEHWNCTAIKRLLNIPITDGPHTTPEFYDKGVPFISAESIKNGVINFDKKRGYISISDYEKYSKKYRPQKHDIYMVKSGATTGRVAMVDTDKVFTIWSPLAVFRTKKNTLLPKFLYMYLQSKSLQKGIELSWTFGTQQNIGMGVLGNLYCVVPTLEEQDEITIYLDSVLSKADATRDSYLAQIERLKEYKTVLINQAVTGKIKVS